MSDVNHGVVEINQRSVRTLAALGDLRDMEGDRRVGVRDYVDAAPADRPALKQDIGATDSQVDADIAAYLAAHASRTDRLGALMIDFTSLLDRWRSVRDQQVLPLADAGRPAAARATVAGAMEAADDADSVPLDALFDGEVNAADARVAAAEHS